MNHDATIQLTKPGTKAGVNEWFDVQWMGPHLVMKAANGNFITVRKNGQMVASATQLNEESIFVFELINRPSLVLRGEHGFVGVSSSGMLESHHVNPEVFHMDTVNGFGKVKNANGKSWKINANGIGEADNDGDLFTFEFWEPSKLAIRAANGKYLQGDQTGGWVSYC